ncbi:hypothetical protein [Methylovirgula sp. 4M-Z18]|uniref:hypothetical protein n=1 Tax=Methylovirgula sp. 4M-Z18 TaxID=2293567 RepID=UPI001313ED08|nr:hypothetical protein [Methylovirgula sp. 4M-Z18]
MHDLDAGSTFMNRGRPDPAPFHDAWTTILAPFLRRGATDRQPLAQLLGEYNEHRS